MHGAGFFVQCRKERVEEWAMQPVPEKDGRQDLVPRVQFHLVLFYDECIPRLKDMKAHHYCLFSSPFLHPDMDAGKKMCCLLLFMLMQLRSQ